MRLDRDTRWRMKTISFCLGLVALSVALIWAMETWRVVLEPVVEFVDGFVRPRRMDYDPSHYRSWEAVLATPIMLVAGVAIWGLFGKNPDRLIDTYLRSKLETQTREHIRGPKD
jgi:hypothetical protein